MNRVMRNSVGAAALLTVLSAVGVYRLIGRLYRLLGDSDVEAGKLRLRIDDLSDRLGTERHSNYRLSTVLAKVGMALQVEHLPDLDDIPVLVANVVQENKDWLKLSDEQFGALDDAAMKVTLLGETNASLKRQLADVSRALPWGYFAGRDATERIQKLADDWRQAVNTNKHLQAQLDAVGAALPDDYHPELVTLERVQLLMKEAAESQRELTHMRDTFYPAAGYHEVPALKPEPDEAGEASSRSRAEKPQPEAAVPREKLVMPPENWTETEIARYPELYQVLKTHGWAGQPDRDSGDEVGASPAYTDEAD